MRPTIVEGVGRAPARNWGRPPLTVEDRYALKVGHPLTMDIATRIADACCGPAAVDRLNEAARAAGLPAQVRPGDDIWDAVNSALERAVTSGRGVDFAESALGLPKSAATVDSRADKCGHAITRFLLRDGQPFNFDDIDVKVNGNKLVVRLHDHADDVAGFHARHARTLVDIRIEAARLGYPDLPITLEPIPKAAYP
jgi:hypothetical protein